MGLAEFFSEVKKGFSKPSSCYYVFHPVFQPSISDVANSDRIYYHQKNSVLFLNLASC